MTIKQQNGNLFYLFHCELNCALGHNSVLAGFWFCCARITSNLCVSHSFSLSLSLFPSTPIPFIVALNMWMVYHKLPSMQVEKNDWEEKETRAHNINIVIWCVMQPNKHSMAMNSGGTEKCNQREGERKR